uniref:Uncharacterized protein n=1 Tax=Ralstonia syzygii R24 TaxID=907261 RepID=G3ABC7_9RALS|nr:hypothetical protein RALSY_mp30127 [Ralstonia syzygii R24]
MGLPIPFTVPIDQRFLSVVVFSDSAEVKHDINSAYSQPQTVIRHLPAIGTDMVKESGLQ